MIRLALVIKWMVRLAGCRGLAPGLFSGTGPERLGWQDASASEREPQGTEQARGREAKRRVSLAPPSWGGETTYTNTHISEGVTADGHPVEQASGYPNPRHTSDQLYNETDRSFPSSNKECQPDCCWRSNKLPPQVCSVCVLCALDVSTVYRKKIVFGANAMNSGTRVSMKRILVRWSVRFKWPLQHALTVQDGVGAVLIVVRSMRSALISFPPFAYGNAKEKVVDISGACTRIRPLSETNLREGTIVGTSQLVVRFFRRTASRRDGIRLLQQLTWSSAPSILLRTLGTCPLSGTLSRANATLSRVCTLSTFLSNQPKECNRCSGASLATLFGLDSVAWQPLFPLPFAPMSKDATTPATKANLQILEENILKAIGLFRVEFDSFKKEVSDQFHFIAEKLTETFNRFDAIDDRLDVIDERLDTFDRPLRSQIHSTMLSHEKRLKRLEDYSGFST